MARGGTEISEIGRDALRGRAGGVDPSSPSEPGRSRAFVQSGGSGHILPHRAVKSKANKWGRAAGHVDLHAAGFFNPYFAPGTTPALRVALYRDWLTKGEDERAVHQRARVGRLRGKVLVSTDPMDQPSFADVLLELANVE